jgi:hypothetical protein
MMEYSTLAVFFLIATRLLPAVKVLIVAHGGLFSG